jgi:hypothetical protein
MISSELGLFSSQCAQRRLDHFGHFLFAGHCLAEHAQALDRAEQHPRDRPLVEIAGDSPLAWPRMTAPANRSCMRRNIRENSALISPSSGIISIAAAVIRQPCCPWDAAQCRA